jgi:hypothetical protein
METWSHLVFEHLEATGGSPPPDALAVSGDMARGI